MVSDRDGNLRQLARSLGDAAGHVLKVQMKNDELVAELAVERAARERAEQQLAAYVAAYHNPNRVVGCARQEVIEREAGLLDESTTDTPCPTCGGTGRAACSAAIASSSASFASPPMRR